MNELSWLIYAADMAGSVKFMAGAAILVSFLGVSISLFVDLTRYKAQPHRADLERWDEAMAEHVKYPSLYEKPKSDRPEDFDQAEWFAWKAIKVPVVALSVSAAVFCFFPASGTIYAIAASEMGERVIKSETGSKAVEALNAWLDRQIANKPSE